MKRLYLLVGILCVAVVALLPAGASSLSLATHTENVTIAGTGTGSVSDNNSDTPCTTGTCMFTWDDTVLTSGLSMTATADTGSTFAGWSGDCSGTTNPCTVTTDGSVTATFDVATQTLNVTMVGSGTVGDGGSVSCTSSCSPTYNYNTPVTLTATPADSTWSFTGWSGDCSGTGSCSVTMNADHNVTATFTRITRTLGVAVNPSGGGSVTASPGTIVDCTSNCSDSTEVVNTNVTLSQTPAPGYVFLGWNGAGCSGTGGCVINMSLDHSVIAEYKLTSDALTVDVAGSGSVTSSPGGISCPSACSAAYAYGTSVTLTAHSASGWHFAGWSGACVGLSPTCMVSMTAARAATARFSQTSYTLTVGTTGAGTVSGGGIDCGNVCSASFGSGAVVSLTATPDVGWVFTGWSGACSGTTASCDVTVDATKSVGATFVNPSISITGVPKNKTAEATSSAGAKVAYTPPTVTDSVNGTHPAACSPASGTTFPLGTTNVLCSALGKVIASFTITVQDTTPPKFAKMADPVVFVNGVARTTVRYKKPKATDAVGPVTIDCTPAPGSSFPLGRNLITCAATDGHGNSSNLSFHLLVRDKTPPGAVSHVGVSLQGGNAVVSWFRPRGADAVSFMIMRSPGRGHAKHSIVYRGAHSTFTDIGLKAGVHYEYSVVALDRVGNRSKPTLALAYIKLTALRAPLSGSRLTGPPNLVWEGNARADYYNVQVWTAGPHGTPKKKIFSTWPKRAHLQLPAAWTFAGSQQRLLPGAYIWFVWPGFGKQAAAKYGPLIGSSTFVIVGAPV